MFQQAPGYLAAFTAGILSFLTPCILPLVPGYISFISGTSLAELQDRNGDAGWSRLFPVVSRTLAFILGFSVVFISTGAFVFYIGEALAGYKIWLIRGAGLVIIVFGLHMAGVLKIKALYQEKRLDGGNKGGSLSRAFILGFAFAFGWTPCAGPILGAILGLASSKDLISQVLILMSLYSAGLAIPFFITGIAVESFFSAFNRIKNHFRKIEIFSGVLLVIIGAVMLFNQFDMIQKILNMIVPEMVERWG
jgi:cytochrome c-type biogenesis protein